VAEIVLPGAGVQIPPAVSQEVVTWGGTRADALKAAELIAAGHIRVEDTTAVSEVLEDLQHYRLGQGETEALTLTTGLGNNTLMVTDDFLVLIVAKRLGLSY
jgi:predicted nucleic acid-binding protein